MSDERVFTFRLSTVLILLAGGVAAWWLGAHSRFARGLSAGEPHLVAPRGDLAADEKAVVDLFRNTCDSVAFIEPLDAVDDAWGNPFTLECEGNTVHVHSPGPDEILGNEDDLGF